MDIKIDLRIIKSQSAIKKAFFSMLITTGFDNMSVKEITNHAMVSRKTFYLHYLDKFELLEKFVSEQIYELEALCKSKSELGLIEGTIVWFDYIRAHKELYFALFSIQSTNVFRNRLLEFMANEIKRYLNQIDESARVSIFIKFFSMAVFGIMESYSLDELSLSEKQIGTEVGRLLEHNIYYISHESGLI